MILIVAILKNFSLVFFFFFFVILQGMDVPNFMSKAFFYQSLGRGGTKSYPNPCPHPPGHDQIRQKHPGADKVN